MVIRFREAAKRQIRLTSTFASAFDEESLRIKAPQGQSVVDTGARGTRMAQEHGGCVAVHGFETGRCGLMRRLGAARAAPL